MKLNLPKELTTVTKTSKILAAIVFITLPFLGFYLGMNYQQTLNSASQTTTNEPILPKRVPTPTPSPTINTSTWKTYTNKNLGISFNYPNDYQIESETDQEIFFSSSYAGNQRVSKSLVVTTKTTDLSQYSTCGNSNDSSTKPCISEVKQVLVDNKKVTKFSLTYGGGGFGSSLRVQTPNIEIYKTVYGGGAGTVFDQILQTFKFTN